MMNKNDVVAVIMGGPSAEREISLVTGAAIAGALREKGYNVAEIDLEPKKLALQLEECSAKVVFNAVHGMYGEDGRLQTLLEMLEIPYTGSGMLASALGMDKAASKRIMQAAGIATPKSLIFVKGETHDFCGEILSAFKKMPVVVKPAAQGSSIGVEIVKMILMLILLWRRLLLIPVRLLWKSLFRAKSLLLPLCRMGAWLLHCLLSISYRIPGFMIFILNIPKVKLNI